jgi:hypothetical protein
MLPFDACVRGIMRRQIPQQLGVLSSQEVDIYHLLPPSEDYMA